MPGSPECPHGRREEGSPGSQHPQSSLSTSRCRCVQCPTPLADSRDGGQRQHLHLMGWKAGEKR